MRFVMTCSQICCFSAVFLQKLKKSPPHGGTLSKNLRLDAGKGNAAKEK
jgi:hypothetical protein